MPTLQSLIGPFKSPTPIAPAGVMEAPNIHGDNYVQVVTAEA